VVADVLNESSAPIPDLRWMFRTGNGLRRGSGELGLSGTGPPAVVAVPGPYDLGMGRRSFSTHRINAWSYAHPVAWGAVMGTAFAVAAFLADLALGSNAMTSLIAGAAGGVVFGFLTFLWADWKRRRRFG